MSISYDDNHYTTGTSFIVITPTSTLTGMAVSNRIPSMRQISNHLLAQSAGAVEYTDYFSIEGYPPKCVLDMILNNSKVPRMLELWGMRSTPSLTSLPGSHLPGVVAPDRDLSIGQIELNCVLVIN